MFDDQIFLLSILAGRRATPREVQPTVAPTGSQFAFEAFSIRRSKPRLALIGKQYMPNGDKATVPLGHAIKTAYIPECTRSSPKAWDA